MIIINTDLAIKYLVEELNLKNEAELAEKLKINKNALSMLKKRNSLGTLIEKVLTNIDNQVSLDKIVYGYNSKCFQAQCLATKNNKEEELNNILENFINTQSILFKIKSLIEKLKGQTFFEKIVEEFSGKGEKMIKFLYYFVVYIEKTQQKFDFLDIKNSFISELKKFELSKNAKFASFELKNVDKDRLIVWIINELDNASILEIISNTTELKYILENELNIFNKMLVKV
ncbi:MAG: hypothetical protein KA157_14580 [Aliarcobacter sp.]|jgi:hypothetical protein|nr:hypothetical protein [Aliarcobacter sp.]